MKKLVALLTLSLAAISISLSLPAIGKSLGDVSNEVANTMNDADEMEINKLNATCGTKGPNNDPQKIKCLKDGLAELSNKGNYIAQTYMAMLSFEERNKNEAIKWINLALENPKTPAARKEDIKQMKQRIDTLP